MWIQVRSMDGKKSCRVDGLSKLTKVEELREKLVEPFDADVESQRLFYRGKQVNNSLFSSVINHTNVTRRFCTANSMSFLVMIDCKRCRYNCPDSYMLFAKCTD